MSSSTKNLFESMTRRRVSCPQITQQLWDAIKNIRGQRQVPTVERIHKFMLKEFGVSEEEVVRQLNHCVRDGLIEITKRTISKGNYMGSEREGYKLPLLSLKPDDFDWYCFDCHRAGDVICCSRPNCLRVYHLACISSTELPEGAFVCHVCKMCEATPEKFQMKKSKLNRLLGYTLQRLKSKYPLTLKDQRLPPPNKNILVSDRLAQVLTPPTIPAPDENEAWRTQLLIARDMNLTIMEDKIDQHRYKLLEEFHVDALNIVHNMVIYNGVDSAVADIARQMLRDCIQDLHEIRQCVDCYKQSHGDKKKLWFCKPCRKPHELVYAKQFGFPYWPAKVIKVEDDHYDVRFFGAQHLRAMIPKAHIRPISVNIHTLQVKRSSAWNKACEELKKHQELLEKARKETDNFTKFVDSSSSSEYESVDSEQERQIQREIRLKKQKAVMEKHNALLMKQKVKKKPNAMVVAPKSTESANSKKKRGRPIKGETVKVASGGKSKKGKKRPEVYDFSSDSLDSFSFSNTSKNENLPKKNTDEIFDELLKSGVDKPKGVNNKSENIKNDVGKEEGNDLKMKKWLNSGTGHDDEDQVSGGGGRYSKFLKTNKATGKKGIKKVSESSESSEDESTVKDGKNKFKNKSDAFDSSTISSNEVFVDSSTKKKSSNNRNKKDPIFSLKESSKNLSFEKIARDNQEVLKESEPVKNKRKGLTLQKIYTSSSEADDESDFSSKEESAEVKMPSGNVDKPVIEDNRDGTVSVSYGPREEGLHELHIKYNGEHVQGSPFKFHVDSISSGYVTAYGPGLSHGVCGEPSNFTIYTKGAGAGGLAMSVEGPSKAEISCHDNKDDTVAVSYLPTAPGEYKISVKFGDKHIKGSPYSAKITGEGRKRNQISVGSCSEVSVPGKCSDAEELRSLNASIQAPSGLEEPCFLKRLPNGTLGISFTPREVGEHLVSVKKMGKHITNSPFKINVADKEVGDAKKVKVNGALKEGATHKDNVFTVDTRNAGYGGLSLSIEGPSKAEISCKDNEDGTLRIAYKPTEPGYYIVNLKFADHHVEGSPFTVKVSGEGSNRVREKIQRQREAVPITEVGSQCKLTFKMPGITTFDLSSTVTSPGGVTEAAEINEVEDGLYAVHFVPKELGVHTVCVKYKDIHIPGSPFQFTVGPLKDGGAHRVHAGGPGLERGEEGQPCEFNVWTREAGAGSLAISVEGPSKAEIDFKDRKDGSCYVSYKVGTPGEYRVGIKFNDQHIPDSPYKVYISPAMGDSHKLEVAQFPESGVRPDHPSSFLVRKNGAKGELDCKIVSPNGTEDDCFIQSIDSDTYSVRFMPRENGINNIYCKFNGVHIPGSPFRIKVGKEDADPAAVRAFGNGLKEIKTGHKSDFIVDTCNAGTGNLAVQIDGPSKVSMDCTEVEEGYKVRYTPLMRGDYYVSIKYNGYHIVGSPFKVSCTGEDLAERGPQESSSVVVETVHKVAKNKGPQNTSMPLFKSDASKVTSKGMGLKKAYLHKQNMFTVNCGSAGNNILFVGIYGPKGPCEEVVIKHVGRNGYQVNYMVKERGDYIVIVKWGEEHIPGSPFKVDV